jgi:uncharacterized membrane protein
MIRTDPAQVNIRVSRQYRLATSILLIFSRPNSISYIIAHCTYVNARNNPADIIATPARIPTIRMWSSSKDFFNRYIGICTFK